MTVAVAVANVLIGVVYCQYGTMTLIEMRRHWGEMGFSHFGAAWIAMAFTCGPHHLVHAQLANRRPLGGWSVSGLALAVIFPTCAVMHAIYAYHSLNGQYGPAAHTTVIDWIGVPAGAYFLWVVHGLYRGTFRDWNS